MALRYHSSDSCGDSLLAERNIIRCHIPTTHSPSRPPYDFRLSPAVFAYTRCGAAKWESPGRYRRRPFALYRPAQDVVGVLLSDGSRIASGRRWDEVV